MRKKQTRFHRTKWIVGGISLLLGLRYLYWRGFHTLNMEDPFSAGISLTVYLAEIYGFLAVLSFYLQIVKPTDRDGIPLQETALPTVDIFVTIYNESIDILHRTLVACAALDYPSDRKKIYVLDDGRREEVKRTTELLGCHYLSRPTNEHAKAGNLNKGLGRSHGDFVMVMDCDHLPVRTFLKETVGFFEDPKVALVQTPHYFYNPDTFQRNLRLERNIVNEQDLFFYVIQPGKDGFNASFFAGSGGVFRRSALEEIGGFQSRTLTEDLHTSMALHAKGHRSVYLNKILAAGLAPESYRSYLLQRQRWTRGGIQLFILDNPLLKSGLTFMQRVHYLASIFYFFHGWPRLVYLIAPLSYFLLNRPPLLAAVPALLTYYLPYYITSFVAFTLMSRKYRNPFWSDVYETVMCFFISWTALVALIRPEGVVFRVTPKGTQVDEARLDWAFVSPHLILSILLLAGLSVGGYRLLHHDLDLGAALLSGFWTIYNLIILTAAIGVARERPQKRASPRLLRRIPCELEFNDKILSGRTVDLSESGLSLAMDRSGGLPPRVHLRLIGDFGETTEVSGEVIRHDRTASGGDSIGIRFLKITEAQRQSVIRQMYSSPTSWDQTHQTTLSVWHSFADIATSSVRAFVKEKALRRTAPRLEKKMACEMILPGIVFRGVTQNLSDSGLSIRIKVGPQAQDYGVPLDREGSGEVGDAILGKEVMIHLYHRDQLIAGVRGEIVRYRKTNEKEEVYGVRFLERKDLDLSSWV